MLRMNRAPRSSVPITLLTSALLLAAVTPLPAATPEEEARAVLERAVKAYQGKGMPAGIAILEKEFEAARTVGGSDNWGTYNRYRAFQNAAWREAQLRTGREDQAWALAITEWMYDYYPRVGFQSDRWSLLSNLVVYNLAVGKLGRVKVLLDEREQVLRSENYLLDPGDYPDLGPVVSELPQIRRRGSTKKDLPPPPEGKRHPLDSNYWDAVGLIASQEFRAGHWRAAIERHALGRTWWVGAVEEWGKQKQSFVEFGNRAARETTQIGYHLEELGFLELADAWFRDFLDTEWSKVYWNRWQQMTRVRREGISITLGQARRSSLQVLDELEKAIAKNQLLTIKGREAAPLQKARLLLALGDTREGWALLEELKSRHPKSSSVLDTWIAARLDAGMLQGLEEILIRRLKSARRSGVKPREITLYRLYARLLANLGRVDEAIATQRELLRLVRAFDFYPWEPHDQANLARFLESGGDHASAARLRRETRALLKRDRYLPPWLRRKTEELLRGPLRATGNSTPSSRHVIFQTGRGAHAIPGWIRRPQRVFPSQSH